MLKTNEFYKKFENLPREDRFALIEFPKEPTSFFVLFQKLNEARKQKKYFEDLEIHILRVAEEAFKQKQNNGK